MDRPLSHARHWRTLDPPGPVVLTVLVTAIVWVADQAVKALVLHTLDEGRVVDLPGPVHLELVFNPGAAFGLPVPWWVILAITVVVLAMVGHWVRGAESGLEPLALGLLAGGALGNVSDRLLRPHPDGIGRGEVIDFIGSDVWPTFNLADVGITAGFALLVLAALRHELRADGEPTEDRREVAAAERT